MTNEEAIFIINNRINTYYCTDDDLKALELAIKALEERPGKWEYTDGRWGLGDWRCSKCGGYSNKDTRYCPNCGARMN